MPPPLWSRPFPPSRSEPMSLFLDGVIILFVMGLGAYVREKSKNVAGRQDLTALTRAVEGTKHDYDVRLAEVETVLRDTSQHLVHRRRVYEELIDGLRVFISGQNNDQEVLRQRGERLQKAYAEAWLWAPDDSIRALNTLLDLNIRNRAPVPPSEDPLRNAFFEAVLSMRRDAGHPDTTLTDDEYRFFFF